MKATVLPYQSLIDVAVSATGDAETAYDVAMQNGMTIDAEPEHGTVMETPAPVRKSVAAYYLHHVKPATGITDDVPLMDGISHMIVNGTFVVGKDLTI